MRLSSIFSLILTLGASLSASVAIEKRDIVSEIWQAIESAATCDACEGVLVLLKSVAELGNTVFVDTLIEVCKLSKTEDDDVCEGSLSLEGPILANDLRQMDIGSKTSKLFCVTFFGLCPYPSVAPYSVPFPSPKPATSRPPVSGQTPLQIVHFSDIHVDPFYETGSSYNCTKPICCRPYTSSDAPGNNSYPAGPNGEHKCDAPMSLEQSMFAAIGQIAPNAVFSLFTGDIVDHAVWNTTQAQNTIDISNAYNQMTSSGLNLVYGTIGNHEASPVNSFPPAQIVDAISSQWVYDDVSADLTKWIGSLAASSIKDFGAYSVKFPGGNLRIISLNTNLYYVENYWLYEENMETDPSGQLAWLVDELQAAENAGERVYIMGHMPMGLSDAFHDGSNYYDQIVNRYSATIAAQFFGHTHVDHFEISYSNYSAQSADNAIMMTYICPSMTPTSGYPAFRVYSVDPVTFGILDISTYIADMTNPSYQTTGPVWTEYYSAKQAYGPLVSPPLTSTTAELTPAFWHNVTVALQNSDADFAEYYARKSRGWNVPACDASCKTNEICQLRAARSENNCVVPSPGLHLGKRAEEECEGSTVKSMLRHLVGRNLRE